MSNPFIKRTVLSSRERVNLLEARTLMSNLNTRDANYKNKHITMKNNKLVKCINYEMLLKYVKGFYQLEDNCDNLSYHVQGITEGKYSYIDFDELDYLIFSGYDNTDPIYVIDVNAQKKGLLWIKGQIFPKVRERIIKFPIPIKKTFICQLPQENLTGPVLFKSHMSDISGALGEKSAHTHFIPVNGEVVYYEHDPTDISGMDISSNNHPNPYPYPSSDIFNNTTTLFPTIPKSSIIRGTVNATGTVTASGNVSGNVTTSNSGTFTGFSSGITTTQITNQNRDCNTERKFDELTGIDMNWTGKPCKTCTSFENHRGLFDVSGNYDPSGVDIDFSQIIDKINPIVHSAKIDMSGNIPILEFISSEDGIIDISGMTSSITEAKGFPTINKIPLDISGAGTYSGTITVTDKGDNTSLPAIIPEFTIT